MIALAVHLACVLFSVAFAAPNSRLGLTPASVSDDNNLSPWAGAVLVAESATYTSITGTFTVSSPSVPTDGSGTYYASAWVGIDGYTCSNAILQTGIRFAASDSGDITYSAWYEWFPDVSYDFTGIEFAAGDSVTLTVTATSTYSGTAIIENNSNGQYVAQNLTSGYALCQTNAEWIVEDFLQGDETVQFANFGTVTFTDAYATTAEGDSVGPDGAKIVDIVEPQGELATAEVESGSVVITYTG